MNNKKYLKPVSRSIKIDANTTQIWELISKPGNLELCHPFCESNPVEKWLGNNSIDYVNYYNGVKFQRIFTDWIDGHGYDLLIGTLNGCKSKVLWRIHNSNKSYSELQITIYSHSHSISKYPYFLKPFIYSFYIKPMLRKYLSSVLKGCQWYIMQGKLVQKNQFGVHKWFSN